MVALHGQVETSHTVFDACWVPKDHSRASSAFVTMSPWRNGLCIDDHFRVAYSTLSVGFLQQVRPLNIDRKIADGTTTYKIEKKMKKTLLENCPNWNHSWGGKLIHKNIINILQSSFECEKSFIIFVNFINVWRWFADFHFARGQQSSIFV